MNSFQSHFFLFFCFFSIFRGSIKRLPGVDKASKFYNTDETKIKRLPTIDKSSKIMEEPQESGNNEEEPEGSFKRLPIVDKTSRFYMQDSFIGGMNLKNLGVISGAPVPEKTSVPAPVPSSNISIGNGGVDVNSVGSSTVSGFVAKNNDIVLVENPTVVAAPSVFFIQFLSPLSFVILTVAFFRFQVRVEATSPLSCLCRRSQDLSQVHHQCHCHLADFHCHQ